MTNRFYRPVAAAILMALVLAGCGEESQEKTTAAPPPPAVGVVRVVARDIRPSIAFTGRIEAVNKVELRARIDGFLDKQLFTEGKDVKEGDLLFVIEKAPYEAAVADAEGAMQSAQASLKRADIEFDRQSTLVAKDVASKSKLEDVTARRDEIRGSIAQLQAQIDKAKLQLSYTDIRAPIAGRIGRAAFSVGNFVNPASGVLATIVSQDPIHASFAVSQREILAIRQRQAANPDTGQAVVRLQLADGSLYPEPGQINFVDVTTGLGTDTVQVRASFANPGRLLVDGQLVGVVVERGAAEATLVVPQAAIQLDQSGAYVLVVGKDSKIEVRRIEMGPAEGANAAVLKGLAAGDLVVTEGIQKVRPGQVVTATEIAMGE